MSTPPHVGGFNKYHLDVTMEPRVWLQLIQRSSVDWNEDHAPRLGAALAFYTILSVSPLVIPLVAAAAIVFSKSCAEVHLLSKVQGMAGTEGREAGSRG